MLHDVANYYCNGYSQVMKALVKMIIVLKRSHYNYSRHLKFYMSNKVFMYIIATF